MPPGSAAPLGRPGASTPPARRGSPAAQPAPSEPARDLGALPGPLASARVLSPRGRAMDGDACSPWLNWRSSRGLARTNVFVNNKNEFSRDQCKLGKPSFFKYSFTLRY